MSPLLLLALFLILLVLGFLSATLSALETALLFLKEHHRPALAGNDSRLERDLDKLARDDNQTLNHVLLLAAVINLTIAALALFLIRTACQQWPLSPLPTALITFAAIILVTDLLPKLVALARPASVFRAVARPVLALDPVLKPLLDTIINLADTLTALLIPKRAVQHTDLTEDELETLVELRRDDGILQESESEMINEIIRLGDKTAKDCMIPRVDTTVMPNDIAPDEADALIRNHPHSHLPVYRDSPDVIIGVLNVRDYLLDRSRDHHRHIKAPVFVPETMMALDLFRDYLNTPHSLAIVLDEFGGMEGVVGHSDLIEEIISDAAPLPDPNPEIQDLGKNRLLVAGNARLDEIEEAINVDLETDGIDTIGGLLFNHVDQLPVPGQKIRINGIVATVRKCSDRRIQEVLIELEPPKTGDTEKPSPHENS
ncbi:MAG: hemolysin family protein [Verrucomicrobiota bacterium]